MSIVALGIIILLLYISQKPYIGVGRPRPVVLLIAIGLGLVCGFFYWTVVHKNDIPVTDRVLVSGGQGMQDSSQATIQIPGMPPQRRHLSLIPTLTNPTKVGDCVMPAQLDITLMIDGQRGQPGSLQPGHEAKLDLAGVTHQANVIVTLHVQDPSCRVDLGVGEAILYN